MKLKRIGILVTIIAILGFLLSYIVSYANDNSLYVNLQKTDLNGVGYGIGIPSNYGNYIWSIRTYDSNDKTDVSAQQRNLYCIKGNYSETWNDSNVTSPQETIVEYNLSYDFQKDKEKLEQLLANGNAANGVIVNLLDENKYYREVLWILDNLYEEGKTVKTSYLEKMFDAIYSYDAQYVPHCFDWEDGTRLEVNELILDTDIKAVERMAIWYFTNYKLDGDEAFNKENVVDWLTTTTDGNMYRQVADISSEREQQIQLLYKALITKAEENASSYKPENGYQKNSIAAVDTSNLAENSGKYVINSKRVGENNVVGPIIIKNGSYEKIELAVKNQNGSNVNYTLVDSNGTSLGNQTIKDQVGKAEGFYISVARSDTNEINVEIKVTNITTKKTLWLKGTETAQAITLDGEQPLVEVTTTEETIPTNLVARPDEFDLALRKYITKVNNTTVNNTRVPSISADTLKTGTTATYNHRKDPVVVLEDDVVTYQLTIFNEGNKAGYATQIIDQLPTGLINSTENSTTVVSKDKSGKDKNTYKLTYNATQNTLIFDIVNTAENPAQSLLAYSGQNEPDSETITIKCKVVEEADTKVQKILTNVAWISGAYDSDAGKVAVDRDSEPETKPNANKDNMENYKGHTDNKSELGDSSYFYKGEQDDDDFEKLVIMPIPKKFDLALFKHIAAISEDQKIENGEYITDNGNIDGTYLRAPVATAIENGKVIYRQDDKEALSVEEGNYVLYTIRVYNEGELDGYASKIKDTLPIGLEFVGENEEYNGIWNLEGYDSDGRQVVTTTWYAKGQGAELNSVPGDSNYTANLLKALQPETAVSEENPDYLDAQVLCRVVEKATSDRVLVNYAQISDDSDANGDPIDDVDSTPDQWIDDEDDQDIERIKLQCFDLSLRKFITQINEKELKGNDGKYTREPVVDVSKLIDKTSTTAIYNHPKTPVSLEIGDKVIYTLRVYNEGDIDGYASEVTDYLPPYLKYVENSEINKTYKWQISEDGRKVTTTYLSDKELSAFNGTELDYEDIKIECIISNTTPVKEKVTNIAEISEYKYNGKVVEKDADSTSDNMEKADFLPEDKDLPTYKDGEMDKAYIPGNEDDDDFEKVYIKYFDLALRKFVTGINGTELKNNNGKYTREPVVDVSNLKNGTSTTATYNHPKAPISLRIGDKVIYTIRVYNEGEVNGYANEVTDYLPPYLKYVEDSEINETYKWQISEDGRKVTTTYLSDKEISAFNGTQLDYEDIQIECIIADKAPIKENITNIAEISEYKYNENVVEKDIDSEADNMEEEDFLPEDKDLPTYKDDEMDKTYIPGNEDDDDFEKVYVKQFDLALRKFITKIQDQDVTTRIPEVKYENGKISYVHPKDALIVHVGDTVIYTLRIYNEGEIDGYASEISDDIPEYLEYLPKESTNIEYMWKMYDENGEETENVEDAVKIKTEYLSKDNGEDNLLKAFDGNTLYYKDIKIAFKVKDPNSNTQIITNYAQISDDTDANGNEIKDQDSETDKWNEGEDDQDIENIKVQYFDLSLLKFVSKVIVIEDGKQNITETGYNGHEDPEPVVKVELHRKKLSDVVVKFGYGITITNEGDIPGYATEITDYIPEGLKFEQSDNPNWKDEGNNVISTRQLEGTLLQPGESATVEVILTWINGKDNLSLKTNIAEISEDKNEYDVPDKDSVPDNQKEGEDDIDIAKVILSIATGIGKTYFTLTLGLLAVVAGGIILIRKFVI